MDAKAIAFKWIFYFIGWLGVLALVIEKCPANDYPGIRQYIIDNVKTWLKALLMYTGIYVLWANALAIVSGLAWAQPFLFVFNYKAAAASFFLAYFNASIVRTIAKKAKDKGMILDKEG